MSSVNKFMVLGRLVKDPELRRTTGGKAVCEFTIVTNDRYVDKSGNTQEDPEYHDMVAWDKQAETIAQHKRKGDELFVVAKKRTSKWEDKATGQKKQKVEFHVSEFEFVGSRSHPAQSSSAEDELPFA